MKNFFLFVCSIFMITSCSSCHDEEEDTQPTRRTVIVYMSAENDLSSFANQNINSMARGQKNVPDNVNLVVFVDRASSQQKPFVARITKDDKNPVDTIFKFTEDFIASDVNNFIYVLGRTITYCPAESYGLVLWGHANGWVIEKDSIATTTNRAYGRDSGNNTASNSSGIWMNIPTMRQGLEQLGVHWKFIFSDCCNMQIIETAYELRKLTDYLIASPAEITGVGAPYETMVKDFFMENDREMAIQMCRDYYEQLDYVKGHMPISAIDTRYLDALTDATREVLPDIVYYLNTTVNPTEDVVYYYAYDRTRNNEKTMYDMKGMIHKALQNEAEKYNKWLAYFDQAVFHQEISYKWHANTIYFEDFTIEPDYFGCISMFFPLEKYRSAVSHPYNQDIKKMSWYYAVGWQAFDW